MRDNASVGSKERGFTLIETAIAMVVLMVAGLATSSLFVYAIKYNTGANDRAVAQAIAQRQMEVVRKTAFGDIAASNETVTAAQGRQFSVDIAVCNDASAACGGSTSVKRVTVTVTPQSGGSGIAINAVTLVTWRSNTATGDYY